MRTQSPEATLRKSSRSNIRNSALEFCPRRPARRLISTIVVGVLSPTRCDATRERAFSVDRNSTTQLDSNKALAAAFVRNQFLSEFVLAGACSPAAYRDLFSGTTIFYCELRIIGIPYYSPIGTANYLDPRVNGGAN